MDPADDAIGGSAEVPHTALVEADLAGEGEGLLDAPAGDLCVPEKSIREEAGRRLDDPDLIAALAAFIGLDPVPAGAREKCVDRQVEIGGLRLGRAVLLVRLRGA